MASRLFGKLSGDTKRNILLVVAAGLVIAIASGTWAMLGEILGWNEGTKQSIDGPALATPQGPVPTEVDQWFSEDLGNLGRPYPPGVDSPQVADLLPQVQGSSLVSSDGSIITLEYPANYVDPDEDEGVMTYAVYRRGDIAVLEALRWRCDWAQAFVEAEAEDNSAESAAARTELEAFPDLDAVRGLPVAKQNEAELEPVLNGDIESGRTWLKEKCGR